MEKVKIGQVYQGLIEGDNDLVIVIGADELRVKIFNLVTGHDYNIRRENFGKQYLLFTDSPNRLLQLGKRVEKGS